MKCKIIGFEIVQLNFFGFFFRPHNFFAEKRKIEKSHK